MFYPLLGIILLLIMFAIWVLCGENKESVYIVDIRNRKASSCNRYKNMIFKKELKESKKTINKDTFTLKDDLWQGDLDFHLSKGVGVRVDMIKTFEHDISIVFFHPVNCEEVTLSMASADFYGNFKSEEEK